MPSNYLILCHPRLLLPSTFPIIRVFSNESVLRIRWPKYWSFSISPSNKYSGLISFRVLVGSLCSPRDSQESSPTPQFKSINSSVLSFLYGPTLTSRQFSSVAQLCPIFCDPMDCSTPDFPVHHQLLELAQTHVHQVSDAINHLILTTGKTIALTR